MLLTKFHRKWNDEARLLFRHGVYNVFNQMFSGCQSNQETAIEFHVHYNFLRRNEYLLRFVIQSFP